MKLYKTITLGLLFLISSFTVADNEKNPGIKNLVPLKDPIQSKNKLCIDIISAKNGVGLSQDVDLLMDELTKLGHIVQFIDYRNLTPKPKVDINVHIQEHELYFLPFAERNYFIPNHEWCSLSSEALSKFDAILCKTKEAERIFTPLHPNAIFMSFTSVDRLDDSVEKSYKMPLHLAGASIQKGTDCVARAWINNPQFPQLVLIRNDRHCRYPYPPMDNIKLINEYISDADLKIFQNQCGLHICPSGTEGFGHYINEARACGAVVVTTNAPPMNEFVLDKQCLVEYGNTAPWNLATFYSVDQAELEEAISNLLSLPESELQEIGKRNRQLFLENDHFFKKKLAEIFSTDFVLQPKIDFMEKEFTKIYDDNGWKEMGSGFGSLAKNTEIYRLFLQKYLHENNIQSVVDIGCGDWQFSKLIDWSAIQYTGFDIVKSVVEKNQKQFSASNITFIHGNPLNLDLPEADLLICKDVLQHLPNEEISSLLPQFSKFKHCLITNDVDPVSLTSNNPNIPSGSYRPIDLTKPPFNLSGKKILTYISYEPDVDVTKQVLYINH